MLIFATIENLRMLSEANCMLGSLLYPLLFIVAKITRTYADGLQEKVAERLEMYLNPYKVILDFKTAVINVIGAVLGNVITIKCCFFYLCQSTFRKLQELGLKHLYENEQEFKLFMGMLDGLAFLLIKLCKEWNT